MPPSAEEIGSGFEDVCEESQAAEHVGTTATLALHLLSPETYSITASARSRICAERFGQVSKQP